MTSTAAILKNLKTAGFRTTTVRTAVIELLASGGSPKSVPDLNAALAVRKITVNKTTLYRELEFLKQQGIVTDVRLNERQTRYEIAGDHHHHLVCTSCDRVEDVELDRELDEQERMIERRTRFKITRHTLEFFGLCGTCRTA
jgi:Fe2+ or Zn2+ uptake regulation protein